MALIGEDADDIGAAFDLFVQALDRVGRVDLHPVLRGEVHVGQHVSLAVVDERAELGPLVAELVGDVAHRLGGVLVVQLGKRLAQGGRHHVLLAFGQVDERGAWIRVRVH